MGNHQRNKIAFCLYILYRNLILEVDNTSCNFWANFPSNSYAKIAHGNESILCIQLLFGKMKDNYIPIAILKISELKGWGGEGSPVDEGPDSYN